MTSRNTTNAARPGSGELSKVEGIKAGSNRLRGTIAEELASPEPAFSHESTQLIKFHGIYQQDDRDVRRERKQRGLGPDHICMVRVGPPGGALTGAQYLVLDSLCDAVGNATMRITTRQGIQFHFVRKGDLRTLIGTLNEHLVSTHAACGDVVRNTICCPAPLADRAWSAVQEHARTVAARYKPRSRAYYDLWVDGERAATAEAPAEPEEEPLYGPTYLPRKFKIGFAHPGDNCIDAYSNDVGVVPVLEGEEVRAFTLLAGGGMGKSHTNPATFPRQGDPLTTVAPHELLEVIDAVIAVQRDHGDRTDREHARLKYLIHEWGIDRFREEVGRVLGRTLPLPEPVSFSVSDDHLGWHDQGDGHWFVGVKVENGRIVDRGELRLRSGIRAVVERFGANVRLTTKEDLLLTDIAEADRAGVDQLLADHGVLPAAQWVAIKRNSFACPALPTCGLALTESERALPGLLDEMELELTALDLHDLDVHVRMTGCPNGCARPYTAEIGFVGRGKRNYDIHLGGDPVGVRMNEVFAENVPRDELVGVLRPVLERYRAHRLDGEGFGAFCHRLGVPALRAELGNETWARTRRVPVAT